MTGRGQQNWSKISLSPFLGHETSVLKYSIVAVSVLFVSLALNVVHAESVVKVSIKDFAFHPKEITISPGTIVQWVNEEKRQYHSVWFEQMGEPEPDYIFPEESYLRTFDGTGEYPYRCGPHPEMIGIVHVK